MKLRRTKKGFTIVELVIVIAVIAVLSAVLIPTFISLNNKANKAADQSLIKNLETALATKAAEEGRNNTMYDALKDAEEAGYKIENLKSKEGKNLVWNQESDRFEIVANNQANYKLWKVYTEVPSTQTFSVYLNNKNYNQNVNVSVGFDAGENEVIPSVTYANSGDAQNVIIRTLGGLLNINAQNDTVNHYGEGSVLGIEAIASSSYHEFGTFQKATIKQGRIVVENNGEIQVLDASGATASVIVEQTGNGVVNNVVTGDNANVNVNGSLTNNIATVATVTTWAALKTVVENASGADVVYFAPTADQTDVANISIARDVAVLGNGTSVSGTIVREGVAYNWQYNGLINIAGAGNVVLLDSLNLRNINNGSGTARAAINVCTSGNDITISNSVLTGQYAICSNVVNADNNKLTLNNVSFGGSTFCSLYWRSSNSTINAYRCAFSSVNTATSNQSNGFGTIVIDFAKKAGYQGDVVNNNVANNVLNLDHCSITKTELGTATQCVVAVYSPYNNVVNMTSCDYNAKNNLIVLSKQQIWNTSATSSNLTTTAFDAEVPSQPSRLTIDGVAADDNLNVVHASTISCCIPIIGGTVNCQFAVDGCDYQALYGYQKVDNGNGTWTYRKA